MKTFFYTLVIFLVSLSTTLTAQNYKRAIYTKPVKYSKKCITTANFPNSGTIVDRRGRSLSSGRISAYYLNGKYYIKANTDIPISMGACALFHINLLPGAAPVNGAQFSYAMNLKNNADWRSTYISEVRIRDGNSRPKLIDHANYYKSSGFKKLNFYTPAGSFKSNSTIRMWVIVAMKAGDTIIIDDPQLKLDCK